MAFGQIVHWKLAARYRANEHAALAPRSGKRHLMFTAGF